MDQQLGMQCGNGASLTEQALSNLEIYGMGAIATFRTFSRRGMACSFSVQNLKPGLGRGRVSSWLGVRGHWEVSQIVPGVLRLCLSLSFAFKLPPKNMR